MTTASPLPAHRRRLEHPKRSRALTRSIVLVVAAFVGGFVVFAGMAVAGVRQDLPIVQAIGKAILLLVVGSAFYSLWTYAALRIYRCPNCGGKTVRVEEMYPAIHKYCAACNVEWITGISHSNSLD